METNKELLVVKIGSNTLRNQQANNELDAASFERIGSQILEQIRYGKDVVIVSSAAGVAGREYSGEDLVTDIVDAQRFACLGQFTLLSAWNKALGDKNIAQILLTQQQITAKNTDLANVMGRLLTYGDIAVVNENDASSHKEIVFGDNDKLAAHFTAFLKNELSYEKSSLVLLSDIHGVYRDPKDKETIIKYITDIDEVAHVAKGAGSNVSKGGMRSKFAAARICTKNGIDMYVAHGRTENAIQLALDNVIGTHFVTQKESSLLNTHR